MKHKSNTKYTSATMCYAGVQDV